MVDILNNIAAIKRQIEDAARGCGRNPEEIKLMAVSKFHPFEMMDIAADYVELLGENRVQEAYEKRARWNPAKTTPWHLIGHLQKNKARKALDVFDLIQTVDSFEIACTLDRILAETDRKNYPVFIEVNTSGEITKEGVTPQEAPRLIERIKELCARLEITGLMTIGPNVEDEDKIRESFASLRKMRDEFRPRFDLELPELSMGMSGDFKIAIEEGSTIVRVGTAIFGERQYPASHH